LTTIVVFLFQLFVGKRRGNKKTAIKSTQVDRHYSRRNDLFDLKWIWRSPGVQKT
jgi:hypothetical protein